MVYQLIHVKAQYAWIYMFYLGLWKIYTYLNLIIISLGSA